MKNWYKNLLFSFTILIMVIIFDIATPNYYNLDPYKSIILYILIWITLNQWDIMEK